MTATVLFGLALGLFVSGGGSVSAQDTFDCPDFTSQAEAQRVLDANPDDPFGLDGNPGANPGDDGVACENTVTFNGPQTLESVFGVAPTATTAPVDPTATIAPVDPTATTTPGEPTAVSTDEPVDPTAVATDSPVDTATQAPVVVAPVTGDSGPTASSDTSAVNLPNTGTGDSQPTSMTTMTLLLALFAGVCLIVGTFGLVRGRRG